jgi:hypothetical protein
MTMRRVAAGLLLGALAGSAAFAQPAACPAEPAPPPAALAAWASRAPLAAAADAPDAADAALVPGRAVDLTLRPAAGLRYAVPPEKVGAAGSHGGLVGLTIARAGTYRVALGAGAWIDVVRDGKAVASTAHGHGPACSGIRKMVDFSLTPGRYLIQLAGSDAQKIGALVARLP